MRDDGLARSGRARENAAHLPGRPAAHTADWQRRTDAEGGQVVAAETIWRLARPWYGDRLASDYTPHTREHNQALLDEVGLSGEFWRLP